MKSYDAIIIDDEYHVREAMRMHVAQNCPELHLRGLAASADEGRDLLKSNPVDLIFLDISMPGEDGFSFLKSIDAHNYAVIFVTAHQKYALKAFRANAVDYLLKPVNSQELRESVDKALGYLELRRLKPTMTDIYNQSLSNLGLQMNDPHAELDKITVPAQFGFRVVRVKDIMYLIADGNYTIIYLFSQEKVVSTRTLGEFEKMFDEEGFFRIHKSTIINLNYLKGYTSFEGNFAEMSDGIKLDISRRKLVEFKEAVSSLSRLMM